MGKLTIPPSNDNLEFDLKPGTQLQFSTEIRARKEDNEAYVIYNADYDVFFMVNKPYYDFIMGLKEYGMVSFNNMCQIGNLSNDDAYDMVSFLLKKKILRIIKK